MNSSLVVGNGAQRLGLHAVSASVASRNGVEAKALWVGLAWFQLRHPGWASLAHSEVSRVVGRANPTLIGFPQFANQQSSKVNLPFSCSAQFQSDLVADERFPDEPFASSPLDLPVASDPPYGVVPWIAQQHTPRRRRFRTILLSRDSLTQSFVRANVVVGSDPTIAAPLLSPQIARRRARRLGFEHPVHLLVGSILFGMPWRDKFDPDAQCYPPSTQSGKTSRAGRSEGSSVVHTNGRGISIFAEQTHKNPTHRAPALILEQPNRQQIATEQIPYRQRLHALSVAGPKPPLEIHGPDLVAPPRNGQTLAWQLRPSPRAARPLASQVPPLQPVSDRSRRGNPLPRIVLPQSSGQLSAAPTATLAAQLPNSRQPVRRKSLRRPVRPMPSVSQSTNAFPLEARSPFVARSATHPEQPTQSRHALLGSQSQLHKPKPSRQRSDLFPRHARGNSHNSNEN